MSLRAIVTSVDSKKRITTGRTALTYSTLTGTRNSMRVPGRLPWGASTSDGKTIAPAASGRSRSKGVLHAKRITSVTTPCARAMAGLVGSLVATDRTCCGRADTTALRHINKRLHAARAIVGLRTGYVSAFTVNAYRAVSPAALLKPE